MRPALAPLLAALPLALAASPSNAADPPTPDRPYQLEVAVGGVAEICDTDWIGCPAGAAICDDRKAATRVSGKLGVAFKGVAPGETLCSAASHGWGACRVFRATVL